MARLRAVVVIHAPGLSGTPRDRPGLERRDERLLDGFLGEVEVAEDADERRDRPALLLAEQAVDDLVRGRRGRVALGQSRRVSLGRRPSRAAVGCRVPGVPDRPDLDRAVRARPGSRRVARSPRRGRRASTR